MKWAEVELSEDQDGYMIWARVPKEDAELSMALLRFVKGLRLRNHADTGGINILAKLESEWLEGQMK